MVEAEFMELKPISEYKVPDYSTYDNSKNKVWTFIINSKKVSVGVLVMFLIYNNVLAAPLPLNVIAGGLVEDVPNKYLNIIAATGITATISIIISFIFGTINDINMKKYKVKKKIYTILSLTFLMAGIILLAILFYLSK